jgi:hypothetical protein
MISCEIISDIQIWACHVCVHLMLESSFVRTYGLASHGSIHVYYGLLFVPLYLLLYKLFVLLALPLPIIGHFLSLVLRSESTQFKFSCGVTPQYVL